MCHRRKHQPCCKGDANPSMLGCRANSTEPTQTKSSQASIIRCKKAMHCMEVYYTAEWNHNLPFYLLSLELFLSHRSPWAAPALSPALSVCVCSVARFFFYSHGFPTGSVQWQGCSGFLLVKGLNQVGSPESHHRVAAGLRARICHVVGLWFDG